VRTRFSGFACFGDGRGVVRGTMLGENKDGYSPRRSRYKYYSIEMGGNATGEFCLFFGEGDSNMRFSSFVIPFIISSNKRSLALLFLPNENVPGEYVGTGVERFDDFDFDFGGVHLSKFGILLDELITL
jgi:hypothetical protein